MVIPAQFDDHFFFLSPPSFCLFPPPSSLSLNSLSRSRSNHSSTLSLTEVSLFISSFQIGADLLQNSTEFPLFRIHFQSLCAWDLRFVRWRGSLSLAGSKRRWRCQEWEVSPSSSVIFAIAKTKSKRGSGSIRSWETFVTASKMKRLGFFLHRQICVVDYFF